MELFIQESFSQNDISRLISESLQKKVTYTVNLMKYIPKILQNAWYITCLNENTFSFILDILI